MEISKYFNKQIPPSFPTNSFLEDEILQHYIYKFIPQEHLKKTYLDNLISYGDKCSKIYPEQSFEAELFKPIFRKYDAFGNIINKLHTSEAWKFFKREGCNESIANLAYKNSKDKYARIVQMIKCYMLAPVSGLSECPLSMTDGAAYLIQHIKRNANYLISDTMNQALERILTSDSSKFYTSGQWMTELLGGSDVRQSTETIAVKFYNDLEDKKEKKALYKLYGFKWFTSAIDSNISFTLAKIKDEDSGKIDAFPTLFFLKTYIDDHSKQSIKLNNINVVKLKDKLGTRQLPTAEMILEGTIAEIASPRGKGLNYIMQLANITRLHNIFNSLGYMRGMISLIEDFSYKRKVFNDFLSNKPLHIAALSNMKKNFEGNLVLGLYVSKLQGIIDYYLNNPSTTNGVNYDTFTQSQQLLRCILPLIKIFTAINSEHICLEGIQCFGAFGYLEDSMIPQLLRDTIVTSIWEGTVNTLCIEFMKSMRDEKTRKSLIILMDKNLRNIFSSEEKTRVQESIGYVKCIIEDIKSICLVQSNFKAILDSELIYREFSLLIISLLTLSLVVEINEKSRFDTTIYWILVMRKYYLDFQHVKTLNLKETKEYVFKKVSSNVGDKKVLNSISKF